MTEPSMSDHRHRALAVEPERSVIVQAPAGSGKTTLLVERYIGLLAVVEEPEQILAITFTRKAAAEMRRRILDLLDPEAAPAPHEQTAWQKARAVAEQVRAWGLRENPQRMLIRTIDSFNHYLARAMPVASRLGPVPAPADNTRSFYRQAARRVLAEVDGSEPVAEDLKKLLLWRDHRSQDIEDLLVSLLARRDQWLRALGVSGRPDRQRFELTLRAHVSQRQAGASRITHQQLASHGIDGGQLLELLSFAAASLSENKPDSAICQCPDLVGLPGSEASDLPAWRAVAELLLTGDGNLRRTVNKTHGFPAGSQERDRMLAILATVEGDQALAEALHELRELPDPGYDDTQWETLAALIRVLEHAAGELELVFAAAGQTDFTGLSRAALSGLGDEDSGYTDLALYLDRRINHILVDEYQDTNWAQFELLSRLVGGWQPGEDRSLFLVGDPMQSIYRFREAEVGLFMRTRRDGIAGQRLESLRLSRNFRARAELVDWVNRQLGPAFPDTEDISAGAVTFAASEPGRSEGGRVEVLARADAAAEAQAIAERIDQLLTAHPDYRAAIIVRSRSHLAAILPALARQGVAYRAVKLDRLVDRPVVRDLLALTRAIRHPHDITAVLSLLRSPLAGMSLEELHALAGEGRDPFAPDALDRQKGPAKQRARRLMTALALAETDWQRRPLRELVEGAWLRLGGPHSLTDPVNDRRDAAAFFESLGAAEQQGLLEDWHDFAEWLGERHTSGEPADNDARLEILTLHAAKGLEWDLVVLPGLDRSTRGQDRELLAWLPVVPEQGEETVLLAPLRATSEASDPALNRLIHAEQKKRDAFERQRLLYVATTRAREHLVLSAVLDPEKEEPKPTAGSLLADLWPTTGHEFIAALAEAPNQGERETVPSLPDQGLHRLPADWQSDFQPAVDFRADPLPRAPRFEIEFNWAGIQARRNGTVLHRLLEQVGRIGIENLDGTRRQRLIERIPALLGSMGSSHEVATRESKLLKNALVATLDSDTGRWILSGRHQQSACELPISGLLDGELVHAVIDRTFIDQDGTRWIIDYKSGYHEGADLDGFLAEEAARYSVQLETYRRLFQLMGETSIRTALYLPRHGRLQEV